MTTSPIAKPNHNQTEASSEGPKNSSSKEYNGRVVSVSSNSKVSSLTQKHLVSSDGDISIGSPPKERRNSFRELDDSFLQQFCLGEGTLD